LPCQFPVTTGSAEQCQLVLAFDDYMHTGSREPQ